MSYESFLLHIQPDAVWILRDQNSKVDIFSKITDFDLYSVHDDVFSHLVGLCGPHIIGSFSYCYIIPNCPRLISRFLQPGSKAVDAFSQDWSSDNNWLVPPIAVIGKVLSHMRDCRAVGTLIVPLWKSACFLDFFMQR